MSTSRLRRRFAAALAAIAGGTALAASLSGGEALKDRQTHMKALGAAAKALGEQFQSGAPDPVVVRLQAGKIAAAADALPTWFPRGSGPETGLKTRALPLIWSDPADFAAGAKHFQLAVAALNTAAAAGDMAAVGAQMRPVGGACKGCHDKFRGPEKS
jgi:cytochrome c556